MDTLYLVAFGIHAFATSLRLPGLCSLVAGIFVTHELSCVEYFKFTRSDRVDVAFQDCRGESLNRADNSH